MTHASRTRPTLPVDLVRERVERFASAKVAVLGDIMLDRYFWGDVERISPEAPVPVVHVSRRSRRLGGAANVAANLAALGAHQPKVVAAAHSSSFEMAMRSDSLARHEFRSLMAKFPRRVTGRAGDRVPVDGSQC